MKFQQQARIGTAMFTMLQKCPEEAVKVQHKLLSAASKENQNAGKSKHKKQKAKQTNRNNKKKHKTQKKARRGTTEKDGDFKLALAYQ